MNNAPGVKLFRLKGHRHQGSLVTQAAGVENGANLAHHVLPLQILQPGNYLAFPDAQFLGQGQVGLFHQGELALDQVQQLAVNQVHNYVG